MPVETSVPPTSTKKSNAGVSRFLFSKLNGMYTAAKSYVPSVANSPLKRIESGVSGVAGLIERNVSAKLVSSLESQLDNLIAPQLTKLNKMAQFAQNIGDRATPTVKRVEEKITSTMEVIQRSKKRFDNLIENAKRVPQQLQHRATAIALDSIQRVDNAVDYIIPDDIDATKVQDHCNAVEDEPSEHEQKESLQLAEDEIEEIVQRSVALSSKTLLGKVNKRIQKRIWKRVASAQGFVKRRTDVIHTNLVDYASTAMDYAVPNNVRAMYAAVLEFPVSANEVYIKLAGEGIVNAPKFHDALQQTMGNTWVECMGPAALAYCEVVNRIIKARNIALQTRNSTATKIQQLLGRTATMTHNSYTVVTERAAIVFNKVAPQPVREAAIAYLKRVNEATELSVDDSFLRKYSSKIAAVVSLAQNDFHKTCVRLYDPIKNKWESQVNFDFGRNLVSLLSTVPTLNFSQVYGFFQGLLSGEQIKKMSDFAGKMVTTVQSPIERVVNDIAPATSKKTGFAKSVEHTCDDAPTHINMDSASMMVPLSVIAERVYTTLGNGGCTVYFDTFLSTLRTEFEQASGKEWKNTLLNAARRMFSQLTDTTIEAGVEETDEAEVIHDISSHSEEDEARQADEPEFIRSDVTSYPEGDSFESKKTD